MNRIRKCVSCGQYKKRSELIKITKEYLSGKVIPEPNSRIFGRSVYLCYNQDCINKAIKKGINKPLKVSLSREELKGLLDGQFKS